MQIAEDSPPLGRGEYPVRSTHFLRIGKKTCIPILLLVRESIISTFNSIHFQELLSILKDRLPNDFQKLQQDEDNIVFSVKTTLQTLPKIFTTDSFQFSYQFHTTVPHFSVLEKNSNQDYQGYNICKFTIVIEVSTKFASRNILSTTPKLSDYFNQKSTNLKKPLLKEVKNNNNENSKKEMKQFGYLKTKE